MKLHVPLPAPKGYGLIELLIFLMIVSTVGFISATYYGVAGNEARENIGKRNAKIIIATHRQAVIAGVTFAATSRDGIITELFQGVKPSSGVFRNRLFRINSLMPDDLSFATRFIRMDGDTSLEFDATASQPEIELLAP
jgi:hypothetical protein